jgi:hypothetical protein
MLWAGIIVPRIHYGTALSVEDILMVVRVAGMALRILFVINLILGLLFWFNVTDNGGLTLLHMFVGILFVACIWLLGLAQGMTKGGSLGLVIGTFVVGLIIAVFGLVHASLVGGAAHWVIQVIHLLLALAGIGIGEASAARYKRGVAAASAA